jgi:hypothetical protein
MIFFKELHENAKWALLIFGALCLLVLLEIRTGNPFILNHLAQERTIFFAPLAGLLMGVAQSVFETRPDNWAFIVHRPVSRWSVFSAKCLAGLVLLYFSLILPCLLAAAWAARPGNVATPFHWQALLPMLADIFNSSCFYFAGIVLTLRKARWFGSRFLPLGLAVASSIVVVSTPQFWVAILFSCVSISISTIAAWSVFATSGTADRGWLPRLALAAMIFAGAIGIGLGLEIFLGVFNTVSAWNGLRVDADGSILRIHWTLDGSDRRCIISDSNGLPLAKYSGVDVDDPANANQFIQFSNLVFDDSSVPWPYSMQSRGYRSSVPEVVRLRAVATPKVEGGVNIGSAGGRDIAMSTAAGAALVPYICVLDAVERIIKLYDPITHVLLGTVGPSGFSSMAEGPSQQFPASPLNLFLQANTHTLTFPSAVYWMELDQHRVRPLLVASTDDPVVSACELPPQTNPIVVVLTRSTLHVLKPSGDKVFTVPFNLDKSKYFFQFAVLPSNHHFLVLADPLPQFETSVSSQVFEYSTEGQLVRQTQLAQIAADTSERKWRRTAIMGAIWPPVLLPLYAACNLDWIFETDYRQCWPSFIRNMLISSLLSGVGAFFLSRRLGFGIATALAWSVVSLLLGPAGVVVILSLFDWPARELCAGCGRRRLVGIRQCAHCGATLPPPALDGREIFEPEDAFEPAV